MAIYPCWVGMIKKIVELYRKWQDKRAQAWQRKQIPDTFAMFDEIDNMYDDEGQLIENEKSRYHNDR